MLKNRTGTVRFIGETAFRQAPGSASNWTLPTASTTASSTGNAILLVLRIVACLCGLPRPRPFPRTLLHRRSCLEPALLCHAHKHLLRDLMRELQAQLGRSGPYEKRSPSIEAAAAYRVAAEQAAPPLVELLAAYELRVAELASSSNPPRSRRAGDPFRGAAGGGGLWLPFGYGGGAARSRAAREVSSRARKSRRNRFYNLRVRATEHAPCYPFRLHGRVHGREGDHRAWRQDPCRAPGRNSFAT